MNIVIEHIEYLISRHDCVVVPGWGAFIAQYQPALIDTDKGMMSPPMRTIGFNASVNHNDALLISSIMRRQRIGYEAAARIVEEETNSMRHQLEYERELVFGRIGHFSKTKDGAMQFEPGVFANAAMGYFGLPMVTLTMAVDKHSPKEDVQPRSSDVIYVPVSRNIFKAVASIILLIALGITLSTPIILDSETDYASIAIPKISTPVKVRPIIEEQSANAELCIALPDESEAIAIADTTTRNQKPLIKCGSELRCVDSDPYCLVVASLASRELAEEYIADHKDASMRILESGGKFRIYVATGATSTQAISPTLSDTFTAQYPAAWVCHR